MKKTGLALALALIIFTPAPALRAEYGLDYSTYLGGTGWDEVYRLAVEGTDIYLAGRTQSLDFPTRDAYQAASASDGVDWDAWVARFGGDGSLVYSSYLGGMGEDGAYDIEAAGGMAYVSGLTASTDFPTLLAYQAANAGEKDLFYCAFDGSGGLVFSSYLGGTGNEYNGRIALAAGGAFYLAGHTFSSDFPTHKAYQAAKAGGSYDLVLTRFSSLTAAGPDFSTYLGGSSNDSYPALCVFGDDAILAGMTSSTDFPATPGAFQQGLAGGSSDAAVAWFDSTGNLLMATFAGGTATEMWMDVGASASEFAVSGGTASYNFPTVDPYQAERKGLTPVSYDNFLTIFNTETCVFSSYLGGTSDDYAGALWFTGSDILLAGHTSSTNFPTVDPFQEEHAPGIYDAFISRFDSGRNLVFSSYLGGSGNDEIIRGVGMVDGRICLAGRTASEDFPTANAFQSTRAGNFDIFLSILRQLTPSPTPTPSISPTPSATPTAVPTPSPQWLDCADPVILGCPISHSGTTAGEANNAIDYGCQTDLTGPEVVHRLDFPGEGDITIRLNTANLAAHLLLLGSCDIADCLADWGPNTDATYIGAENKSYFFVVDSFSEFSGAYELAGTCFFYATPTPVGYQTPTPTLPPTPPPTATIPPTATVPPTPIPTATPEGYSTPTPTPVRLPWIFDYDGDGTTDIGIFRPTSGLWAIRGVTRAYWGRAGDEPVPGDYNGDRTTDIGAYRISTGYWFVKDLTRVFWGKYGDLPIPADYDADATTEIGVYRPSSGLWAIRGVTRAYWGKAGGSDVPVPGDYSGDGTAEIGCYRPSTGYWFIKDLTKVFWGKSGDLTARGDYNADATVEIGVYRPSSGLWAIRGVTRAYWGRSGDLPVPGYYDGDGTDYIGAFRPSTGYWFIKDLTKVFWGKSGDVPVSR